MAIQSAEEFALLVAQTAWGQDASKAAKLVTARDDAIRAEEREAIVVQVMGLAEAICSGGAYIAEGSSGIFRRIVNIIRARPAKAGTAECATTGAHRNDDEWLAMGGKLP